jgi:AcrR family transcriptional regulator
MSGVARVAGVSKASVYRRYPGKGDLVFAAAFGRHFPVESQPDTGSLEGDLRAVVLQQVRVFDTPEAREALPGILADFGREEELRQRLRAWYTKQRTAFVPVLERARARGELDPRISIDALVDAIDGSLFFRAAMTGEPLDGEYAEALVALVLHGVRA